MATTAAVGPDFRVVAMGTKPRMLSLIRSRGGNRAGWFITPAYGQDIGDLWGTPEQRAHLSRLFSGSRATREG